MNPTSQQHKTKVFKGNFARVMMQVRNFEKSNHVIDSCSRVTCAGTLAMILFYIPIKEKNKKELTPDRKLRLSLAQQAYKYTMQLDRLMVS